MHASLRISICALAIAGAPLSALASPPGTTKYTPTDALDLLMAGNVRFSSNLCEHRNADTERVHDTAAGQSPFAIVLSCADSRLPVERVFDRGIGDVFTVRVAGNTSGPFQAGSIEYAVEHLGAPLLVVLGHSSCGAVKAATGGGEAHGNIGAMLAPIVPAVAEARAASPDATPDALVDLAVRANVMRSISDLFASSPTIASATESGTLRVVGAVYNLESGRVEWLGQHPDEQGVLARAREARETPVAIVNTPEPAPASRSQPTATTAKSTGAPSTKPAAKPQAHAKADEHH